MAAKIYADTSNLIGALKALIGSKSNINDCSDGIWYEMVKSESTIDDNVIESGKGVAGNIMKWHDDYKEDMPDVKDVHDIIEEIKNLNSIKDNITNVDENKENISSVSSIKDEVVKVSKINEYVKNVSENTEHITNVDENKENIDNLNNILSEVQNVSNISDNVKSVSQIHQNVVNVDTINNEIKNVDNNKDNIISVSNNVSSVINVDKNINNIIDVSGMNDKIDDFLDKYTKLHTDMLNLQMKIGINTFNTYVSTKQKDNGCLFIEQADASFTSSSIDSDGNMILKKTDDDISIEISDEGFFIINK